MAQTTTTQESNGTGWFVAAVVSLALIAIGWLIFSANPPSVAAPLHTSHVKVSTATGHGSATHIGGGLFVTAAHVVGDSTGVKLGNFDGTVLWTNTAYDIALIRGPVDIFDATPMVCSTPAVGTVGQSYGNPMDLEDIVTTLRVAGAPREYAHWKVTVPVDGTLGPGMSGGGYIVDGKLVGVNVGVALASLGGLPSIYGVAFVVPSSVVCSLMGRS